MAKPTGPSGKSKRKASAKQHSDAERQAFLAGKRAAMGMTKTPKNSRNLQTGGFLGVEKKFYDTARALTAIANTAGCATGEFDPTLNTAGASTPSTLSCPSQGDGPEQRDGKRVIGKYLRIAGMVRRISSEGTAAPANDAQIYIAVVLDTQTNGAQLNSEDVFKNITGEATGCVPPERNLLFGSRFKILKSEVFDLSPTTVGNAANTDLWGYAGLSQTFDWYIPLKNMIFNFNAGTTSDVANCIDNSLHLIAFSSNSGSGTEFLTYNARFRFLG